MPKKAPESQDLAQTQLERLKELYEKKGLLTAKELQELNKLEEPERQRLASLDYDELPEPASHLKESIEKENPELKKSILEKEGKLKVVPEELQQRQRGSQEQEEQDQEQQNQEQHPAPLTVNLDNVNTDYSQKYDKDEAIKASNTLASSIIERISKGEPSATAITNIVEQNHVIRSLKKQKPDLKMTISFQNEFALIENKLLSENPNAKEVLKEFITDVSKGDEITFSTDESMAQFLQASNLTGVEIDMNKMKVKNPSLSQQKDMSKLAAPAESRREQNNDEATPVRRRGRPRRNRTKSISSLEKMGL